MITTDKVFKHMHLFVYAIDILNNTLNSKPSGLELGVVPLSHRQAQKTSFSKMLKKCFFKVFLCLFKTLKVD